MELYNRMIEETRALGEAAFLHNGLPPNYEPEIAARLMYWSLCAAYSSFDPKAISVGANHLHGKVRLQGDRHFLMVLDDGDLYIVFRGTSDLKDVYRDATFLYTEMNDDADLAPSLFDAFLSCLKPFTARAHRGLWARGQRYLETFHDTMIDLCDGDLRNLKRLFFAGHSLGGAAAQIAGLSIKYWHTEMMKGTAFEKKGDSLSRGVTYNKDTHPQLAMREDIEIAVYSYSAPRLGNYNCKQWTEWALPSMFNHVYGHDLVAYMAPWSFTIGWQLVAYPTTMRVFGFDTWRDYLSPTKWVGTLVKQHMDVLPAFLEWFYEHGVDDVGAYRDMTEGLRHVHKDNGFHHACRHHEKAARVEECVKRHALHDEVHVVIRPPHWHAGWSLLPKRLLDFLMDGCTLAIVLPPLLTILTRAALAIWAAGQEWLADYPWYPSLVGLYLVGFFAATVGAEAVSLTCVPRHVPRKREAV